MCSPTQSVSQSVLPTTLVKINGTCAIALVDTGCEQTILSYDLCVRLGLKPRGLRRTICMLNGEITRSGGEVVCSVAVQGKVVGELRCLVASELVCGVQAIIGMDAILGLGGVQVSEDGVRFEDSSRVCMVSCQSKTCIEVKDTDFHAAFDGNKWMVKWEWIDGVGPELKNQRSEYAVDKKYREEYEKEITQWIDDGWLVKYEKSEHGQLHGTIPLMAAKQPNKPKKVRPVMDYRELNASVKSNPGANPAICQDKLRQWRVKGRDGCLLDLKKAYLQIHIDGSLRRYQAVRFKGETYVMTRMGFGLNIAPKVMSKIIEKVLSLNEDVAKGTDHYIDDIWVDTRVVSAEVVRSHLRKYGLETKDPEPICNARVLGLRVWRDDDGVHTWKRDGELPQVGQSITRRELFSVCGKLVGHYPVAGWLRTACSYVKRLCSDVSWDCQISQEAKALVEDLLVRVQREDPVKGTWSVENQESGKVWCDASSIGIGVSLEMEGRTVEDAAWLRKEDDGAHINLAELEAVLKGISLALKWQLKNVAVVTDSATVFGWVRSTLEDTRRPKVTGLGEMIVRRRLGLLRQMVDEYGLMVTIELVPSERNCADSLTRVPQKWLRRACVGVSREERVERIRSVHDMHHFGVARTQYLASRILGYDVTQQEAESVVRSCSTCRCIDPYPVQWDHGSLGVDRVWQRLAIDITHVQGRLYLSLIDCGPSRFAIWEKLPNERAETVVTCLEKVFRERGPPAELLSDNGPCFKNRMMEQFLNKWGVKQILSCAYRPAGNGIVERNHRTIKRMAARTGRSVEEMLFWYNQSPNKDGIVPAMELYQYHSRLPGEKIADQGCGVATGEYCVGDLVYVKPVPTRCTSVWKCGEVTAVISDTTIEVDGVNRHVADLRPCDGSNVSSESQEGEADVEISLGRLWEETDDGYDPDGGEDGGDDSSENGGEEQVRRSSRPRHLPERYGLSYTH